MTVSVSKLLRPYTAKEIESEIFDVLSAVGFPITSWHAGAVPRHLVHAFSSALAKASLYVHEMASGAFRTTAAGDWLTAHAEDVYDEQRGAEATAVGEFLLEDVGGGGPWTITAGSTRFVSARKVFVATSGGTLASSGSLPVQVSAAEPGEAYNLPLGAAIAPETDMPGVTVTNPDNGTGTWLTQSGVDEQSDASLSAQCGAKWAALAIGSHEDAFVYWGLQSHEEVNRVRVYGDAPDGPGTIRIVLASASGPLSAPALAQADAYLRQRKPIGAAAMAVVSASAQTVNVSGVVHVKRGYQAQAEAEHQALFARLTADTPSGTEIPFSQLIEDIMAPEGVTKVVLTAPGGDIHVGTDSVPVFSVELEYVA